MSADRTNTAEFPPNEAEQKRAAAAALDFPVKDGQQMRSTFIAANSANDDATNSLTTEIDERNQEARREREITDDNRLAEISGTRVGHIEVTGLGAREKARTIAQEKAKSAADTRMHVLLALQAQLEALDFEIAQLDIEIEKLEEQINALDGLLGELGPDEKVDPNDPRQREWLDKSGIPKEEWGNLTREDIERIKREREEAKREREAERDQKREQRAETKQEIAEVKNEAQADNVTDNRGSAVAEASSEGLSEEQQDLMKQAVHKHNLGGNTAAQNSEDTQMQAAMGSFDLGGGGVSYANSAVPDNTLKRAAPPVQKQFDSASAQRESVEPDAQLDLAQKRDIDPINGMG